MTELSGILAPDRRTGLVGSSLDGTGPPGFEPGSEAPEASVMSKLYYGPAAAREPARP